MRRNKRRAGWKSLGCAARFSMRRAIANAKVVPTVTIAQSIKPPRIQRNIVPAGRNRQTKCNCKMGPMKEKAALTRIEIWTIRLCRVNQLSDLACLCQDARIP